MIGKFSAAVLALMLGAIAPSLAQDANALCSDLAASPYDPQTPAGQGKEIADIDATAAVQACQDAVQAAPDDARMHFQLGRALDAAERYADALAAYGTAAERGFALANVSLGNFYEFGLGVEPDAMQAVQYYQAAFDAEGLPIAAANLGYAYDHGIGVDPDKAEAARLYQIASDAKIAWATTNLGYFYEQGTGVEADYAKAVELYKIAAEGGDATALNNLGTAYLEGEGGLEQSVEQAIKLYEEAADAGSGLAMGNLGDIYAYGRHGIAQDIVKARDYMRAAIASDDPAAVAGAQNNLAWSFVLEGSNLAEAEELSEAAVAYDAQNAANLDTLGWIKHLRGDEEEALKLLSKAARILPATTQLAHLGAVQAALGDTAGARQSYEAALAAADSDFEDPTIDLKAIRAWLAAN
jgi:hypothetical protein